MSDMDRVWVDGETVSAGDLYAEVKRLRAELATRDASRPRLIAQMLIECIGASGPESAEETVMRACAELATLRAQVPVWTTVTEDPATLPEIGRRVLIMYGDIHIVGEVDDSEGRMRIYIREESTGDWYDLDPGDRWTYVPEVPA